MEKYANLGERFGVREYSIGADYIDVKFSDGSLYRFSYRSAGASIIEKMKLLAVRGYGLNSLIMRSARTKYEWKK